MKIDKNFILKNIVTIACIASIIILLLPYAVFKVENEFLPEPEITKFNGFDLVFGDGSNFFGWIILLVPIVLVLMNYIEKIKKFKTILTICLPLLSVMSGILSFFSVKRFATVAGGAGDAIASIGGVEQKSSFTPSIGFWLVIVVNICIAILGIMLMYGISLSKNSFNELKERISSDAQNGANGFLDSIQNSIGNDYVPQSDSKVNTDSENNTGNETEQNKKSASQFIRPSAPKKTNIDNAQGIMDLIKDLNKMKEDGVLTQEEFDEKKKELLSQL